ncbi:transcription-repair coupling factor [Corynebacterium sp. 153RC1]|uniref:transcription-repair coupling factor n=1 Tax=unclassified Corynebacterium TaxID=2624378 RepID=UPI00211CD6C9|nr:MULTISPECIES: transcription-repair coupling factor [unclassified Corynebacterium]MCQ9370717.1 transcription-repair coupling factor [Corynebacterium sp. 35RC1]MCQ9352649.1 transcription-repair coupling factor [Corynebacterium sp. 209RC1]MCQ9354833.1 transcription-repair coupling factor [Corynebacterium sp. 1222RC1]MCQ9357018.1 transcription-repair coupling factor [Corynebacterium sp. 122RC1]MCQ9359101.1 transcription-repair coupling factor [Corynebacterium sp. 142RC1]
MLAGLLKVAASDPKLKGVLRNVGEPHLHLTSLPQARPWALATLAQAAPVLVVTATGREAEDLSAELAAMLGNKVAWMPAWETLPHERLSPGADIVGTRASILDRISRADDPLRVVVTAARGVAQPIMAKAVGREALVLQEGAQFEIEALHNALVERAYQHVDLVAKRGEFASRGGIVDVFPTTADQPVRLEFWGDEITEIREFSVADQRAYTEATLEKVHIYPARELLITEQVRERAAELATKFQQNPTLQELLTKISEGMYSDGMEALIPVLQDEPLVPLMELMPQGTHVVALDPEKIRRRVEDLQATDAEFLAAGWEAAAMGAAGPVAAQGLDLEASSYRSYESLQISAQRAGGVWWTMAPPGMFGAAENQTLDLGYEPGPTPRGDLKAIDEMMALLLAHTLAGGRAAYIAPAAGAIKRMQQRFAEKGIATRVATPGWEPSPGEVTLYQALSHAGLVFPKVRKHGNAPAGQALPLVVVTETDLTGNRVGDIAGAKRRKAKKRHRVDPLALKTGDYVVHETHGIGRFLQMTERTITTGDETSRREYVVLEYAPSKRGNPPDQLYVPMDSLDLLSKYVGGEAPTLSKMGGSDWKNTKKKARAAVREIAGELVELYAKRQSAPGHAFAPDSPWQQEMEDNFPFVETEDQMLAIEAVKEDMEKPVPMDRVVVGDVGYGKTEVAVRAAFKAVQDGTQVVVLVPTTLLAQQHLATFEERMAGFPVTIKGLSRFTSAAEAKEILRGLADGSVDIVIGTHRLLQTGVQWKNLGLVVVDEEQRFGVEHKEHIKALRTHVDVLTMSATPIPRTLEMSMAGIREMSTILTPPEDRHPILTYVGVQEEQQVAAAIRRELLRDGQVFYVHNKVADIEKKARELRDLVPEARIVVAHGQMSEELLERTVQGFWDREYDVLVCTTIVETGLDIANANTLIVENAHHMGLSQLHQLRGRVGRSRQRGYAYFLYPKGVTLTETSYDRLATIAANNDLGAGMAVAMKDLEMRGAGNVLGAQQSGHIAGVGFDLYVRLVGEAVEAYRAMADGKVVDATEQGPKEIRIDLPVDAHIPEKFINAERLRLEVYRKLASAQSEADIRLVVEEMEDRFGPVPAEVQRLLAVARLRLAARAAGISDIGVQGTRIKIHPVELPDSKQVRLKRLQPSATFRAAAKAIQLSFPKQGRNVTDKPLRDVELLQWVADFLHQMFEVERVNVAGGKLEELPTLPSASPSSARARETAPRSAARSARSVVVTDDDLDYEDKREARRRKYRLR